MYSISFWILMQVYFQGILGGGNLGDLVNTVLNMFGKKLFDKQKGKIEAMLNNVLKKVVNKELGKERPIKQYLAT